MGDIQSPKAENVRVVLPRSGGGLSNSRRRNDRIRTDTAPVIWALDAFSNQDESQIPKMMSVLHEIFPHSPIHPVYVLSEESFTDRGVSTLEVPGLKPLARKAMDERLSDFAPSELKKARVLLEPSASRTACARRLLRYAERIGARLIALCAHGRKGLSRFFIGSFSEAVIDHSRQPVLLTGPQLRILDERPNTIVFPTDFSPACEAAFDRVIELASSLQSEIHLFHKTVYVMDPIVQSGVQMLGGGWVSMDAYLNEPPDDHSDIVQQWILKAQTRGVKVRYLHENFREPTSDAIVQYVRSLGESSVLLAMVSQTGPIASAFLGSVTRDVVRMSPVPVYLVPNMI